MKKIRTQKAAGIIKAVPKFAESFGAHWDTHTLIQSLEDIESHYAGFNNQKYFGRPCPVTPKHGFVDSQPVTNKSQAKSLFKKMIKQDPAGELLLAPHYHKTLYNAICVTSGLLSVGPGHDGATAGKNSISIPVAPLNLSKSLLKSARISENDACYIEAIYTKPWAQYDELRCYITQMRGGPQLNVGSPDFIPNDCVVKTVVQPIDDLILWADIASKFKPGTVVYGAGHTLSSHAAVHCVLHGIPFITTFEPKPGQSLKKSSQEEAALSRSQFSKGVSLIIKNSNNQTIERLAQFSLAILHNWAYIRNYSGADWLAGAALASLLKVGTAICYGELRHHASRSSHQDRRGIYETIVSYDAAKDIAGLHKAMMLFADGSWDSAYGGIPWAMCCHYMIELNNAIERIFNSKTKNISGGEIAAAIDVYNKIINLEHNGGWWFNKIMDKSAFDSAAQQPAKAMLLCADTVYQLHTKIQGNIAMANFAKINVPISPFIKLDNGHLKWIFAYTSGKITVNTDQEKVKLKDLKFKLSEKDLNLISNRISKIGGGYFYRAPLPIKDNHVMISKTRKLPLKDIGI